jgi:Histidine kinase-, DNA gyrase B-, and HSP90-like ATPase
MNGDRIEHELVEPDPRRMMEGLRDTGYEFVTAMADIIDNSVAAEATVVNVSVELDYSGEVVISISDNGCGMSKPELKNAMKYGASERQNLASLGKYGLGMKTASTAFCRRLSVLSRESGEATAHMAIWDIDHVTETNKWDLLITDEPPNENMELLDAVAPGVSGTVVIWGKVDRLIKSYQSTTGAHAKNALKRKVGELKEHVAMVYQRFLDIEDPRARNIEIMVNGESIEPWDPFVVGHSELVAEKTMEVQTGSGVDTEFTVRAYILPRKEEFSSEEVARRAKVAPNRQGIYIYREGRLIVDASWLGLFKMETHYQLLRIEFSFNHLLDEEFHLDIKKSQILLNEDLLRWLRDEFLTAPRREADRRSRKGAQQKIAEQGKGAHVNSNTNIKNRQYAAGGAKVIESNAETGEATVENKRGIFKLKIPVEESTSSGEIFVKPVESIGDGLLFEPAIIDTNRAVKINMGHSYYGKVYLPNLNESVTIQGMDALLWALSVAELTTVSDKTAESFKDLRYEVSRILSKLVESLPDPSE